MDERLKKLETLKRQREVSQKANRKDVYAEHQKGQKNHKEDVRNAKTKREAEILSEKLVGFLVFVCSVVEGSMLMPKRQKAEEDGIDYDRVRALTYSVEAVERYEKKEKAREKRKDIDFTDYAQMAAKKYKSLTKQLTPNIVKYAEQKTVADIAQIAAGTAVVLAGSDGSVALASSDANAAAYAAIDSRPSKESVLKLVKDVEKQTEKRKNFSKRRAHNPDDDVTYINERNMRFNKKISRAYDKHTAEIKAAFERGTAL
ncbi:SYF2 splicing factor-domain-containing protein [Chytriomyces sp. MP71]|nr:SYF2 splicing factor-domain-containing protein [Chytriomyces sp. MP71]